MPKWKELLDRTVARKTTLPSHVTILRLPLIDGWEPGRVWCTWKVDPELIQPQGNLFGGYISAVADEMVGMATISVLAEGEAFTTSDSRVHYFRPVRGGELKIDASVLHRGGSRAHVEVTFTSADDELVAKASATQIIRSPTGS
jgi:uncharacterized protein (TIGR00369 family)